MTKLIFNFQKVITQWLLKSGKTKNIIISEDTTVETRLSELERKIGNEAGIQTVIDNNGDIRQDNILASGLMKEIEDLKAQIEELKTKIKGA